MGAEGPVEQSQETAAMKESISRSSSHGRRNNHGSSCGTIEVMGAAATKAAATKAVATKAAVTGGAATGGGALGAAAPGASH
jgi:hypothetical protein